MIKARGHHLAMQVVVAMYTPLYNPFRPDRYNHYITHYSDSQ